MRVIRGSQVTQARAVGFGEAKVQKSNLPKPGPMKQKAKYEDVDRKLRSRHVTKLEQRARPSSVLNTGFVSMIFDTTLNALLQDCMPATASAPPEPERQREQLAAPEPEQAQSRSAPSPLPLIQTPPESTPPAFKGFGSAPSQAPPRTKDVADNSRTSALEKAIQAKREANAAARASAQATALEMDIILGALPAEESPPSRASELRGRTGALYGEEEEEPAARPTRKVLRPLPDGILQHLRRLGLKGDQGGKLHAAGSAAAAVSLPSSIPAEWMDDLERLLLAEEGDMMKEAGSAASESQEAGSATVIDSQLPSSPPLDLLDDLESLLAAEEGDVLEEVGPAASAAQEAGSAAAVVASQLPSSTPLDLLDDLEDLLAAEEASGSQHLSDTQRVSAAEQAWGSQGVSGGTEPLNTQQTQAESADGEEAAMLAAAEVAAMYVAAAPAATPAAAAAAAAVTNYAAVPEAAPVAAAAAEVAAAPAGGPAAPLPEDMFADLLELAEDEARAAAGGQAQGTGSVASDPPAGLDPANLLTGPDPLDAAGLLSDDVLGELQGMLERESPSGSQKAKKPIASGTKAAAKSPALAAWKEPSAKERFKASVEAATAKAEQAGVQGWAASTRTPRADRNKREGGEEPQLAPSPWAPETVGTGGLAAGLAAVAVPPDDKQRPAPVPPSAASFEVGSSPEVPAVPCGGAPSIWEKPAAGTVAEQPGRQAELEAEVLQLRDQLAAAAAFAEQPGHEAELEAELLQVRAQLAAAEALAEQPGHEAELLQLRVQLADAAASAEQPGRQAELEAELLQLRAQLADVEASAEQLGRQAELEMEPLRAQLADARQEAETAAATSVRLAKELGVQQGAALDAAGSVSAVLARLLASDALGAEDKLFFAQTLNRLLIRLVPIA